MFEERKIASLEKKLKLQQDIIKRLESENSDLKEKLEEAENKAENTSDALKDALKDIREKQDAINKEYKAISDLKKEFVLTVAEIKNLKKEATKEYKKAIKDSKKTL